MKKLPKSRSSPRYVVSPPLLFQIALNCGKEYIEKVVRKLEKSGHKHRRPSSSTTQATPSAVDTPNSLDGVDAVMTEMTVEEAMDMDPASESEEEGGDENEDMDVDEETGERGGDIRPPALSAVEAIPLSGVPSAADPRRRPPNEEDQASVWDPPNQTGKLNGVSVA
jgi:histone-lysine N-methyltransferase SETD2